VRGKRSQLIVFIGAKDYLCAGNVALSFNVLHDDGYHLSVGGDDILDVDKFDRLVV
jgi:hypothetical protein